MKVKLYLAAALLLVSLVAFLPLSQGAPPGSLTYGQGEYIDVSQKSWIEYPQPIPDPLGHPTRPWQPVGEFPWEGWGTPAKPYTATMLMYFSEGDHDIYNSKFQDYSGISARMNRRELLTQRKFYVKREVHYENFRDLMQYGDDKPGDKIGPYKLGHIKAGDRTNRRLLIYETPADVRGTGAMKFQYLNSPVHAWKLADSWNYSPGLRRVTRASEGDRQDELLGTPVTLDDSGVREIWEQDNFLIGEDVLYVQLNDPQFVAPDRHINTGDFVKDGQWFARNADPARGEAKLSPYRPDGGIECWVVLSRWAKRREKFGSHVYPDPKQYYLKYRLTWIEKTTKFPLLKEQYDHDNRLIKNGFTFNPEIFEGGFVNGGNLRTQYQMYDFRRHFRSWGSYDRPELGPNFKAPDDWFTPEHMFREFFWKKVKIPMYKEAKQFAPAPPLFRTKFPKYRKGTSDWLGKDDLAYMRQTWKLHGWSDEEIDAMMEGDGVIRKGGKYYPVRTTERPRHIHGKPLPVKFPLEGPYTVQSGKIGSAKTGG